jgi:hypothetical protein
MADQITEVTRRAIIDFLGVGPHSWHGRLEEVEFLWRVFDLKLLPSTDGRFKDAAGDIWQHTVRNPGDWQPDWVFYDPRFDLLHGPDETFLRFLCETLHPVVRPDQDEAVGLVQFFNEHLAQDGWEIVEKTSISNKPVYAARPLFAAAGVPVKAAKEVATLLDADYVSQQITRMEAAIASDPELAIGTAKEFLETICGTILNHRRIPHPKDEQLPKLVKMTLSQLSVLPDELADAHLGANSSTLLLKNLAAIGHHVAELRNAFGTGHGKKAEHKGLEPRHARLVVGAAATLGVFLFECHQAACTQREK